MQDMTPEHSASAASTVRLPLTAQNAVYAGNTVVCFVTSR
ncbi:hypothetical protein D083_4222 [Dickeya solani RNS 08.23.3.1.A]|nr:hypothetical protein D083_4222 [Dickeya solani RNS 08.23.3.1.A]